MIALILLAYFHKMNETFFFNVTAGYILVQIILFLMDVVLKWRGK